MWYVDTSIWSLTKFVNNLNTCTSFCKYLLHDQPHNQGKFYFIILRRNTSKRFLSILSRVGKHHDDAGKKLKHYCTCLSSI